MILSQNITSKLTQRNKLINELIKIKNSPTYTDSIKHQLCPLNDEIINMIDKFLLLYEEFNPRFLQIIRERSLFRSFSRSFRKSQKSR